MQFSSSDDHSVGSQSSQDSANGKITKRRKKGGLALSKNKSLQWYSLGGVILLICVLTSIRSTHFLVRQSKENDHAVLGLPLDQASKKITKGIVQHNQITKRVAQPMILAPNDFIYKVDWDSNWDSAPIVVERYKLVFFVIPKVACTTWKQLFRRIEGYDDWDSQDPARGLPHNPRENGLKYLSNYSLEEANHLMTSPEYTRAIFLREPKHRFLSAFLDKALSNSGSFVIKKCCPKTKDCLENAQTLSGFLDLVKRCHNPHWAPQSQRMEPKYWRYIDFVGHVESIEEDSKRLLQKVRAWEDYGKSNSVFERKAAASQNHATNSEGKIWTWYTPALERKVEEYYIADYANPYFNYPITNFTRDFFVSGKNKIYKRGEWDGAPIVVEKYNLIFFTVPKAAGGKWKQAFRRMEGFQDWNRWGGPNGLPHDPDKNGLKYLYDYSAEKASEMMKNESWTRAIFLRNPKDRFLSIYQEFRYSNDRINNQCCPKKPVCSTQLSSMIRFLDLIRDCRSPHWDPQWQRMEPDFWEVINFVGKIENIEEDSRRLLEKIGAWDAVGKSGWGPNGEDLIFNKNEYPIDLEVLGSYTPVVDRRVEEFYKEDYGNNLFSFTKKVSSLK